MNEKMLYDLLKEVREDQKKHGDMLGRHGEELAKQSVCIDNIQKDVGDMKKDIARNTDDVAEHMSRTDIAERNLQMLQELHKDNQKRIAQNQDRIKKLEEPVKAKEWLGSNFKWMITVLTLVAGLVTKILDLW